MTSRALLLIAVSVMSPAWSREPSFDPYSNAVKDIVRATAATQLATTAPIEEVKPKDAKAEPDDLSLSEVPLIEEKAPIDAKPALPPPPRRKHAFLSAMIDTLVEATLDNWLGTGGAYDTPEWTGCRYVDPNATSLQYEVSPECLRSASYLP